MDFPDLKSIKSAAKMHGFRPMLDREAEEQYREALADHVRDIDVIESGEIRFGIGWDKWTDKQKRSEMHRAGM
jgi:hypothetical protein